MRASKNNIIKANQDFYFTTYAKKVARSYKWIAISIAVLLAVMTAADMFVFLWLSYIRQAAGQQLEVDVSEQVKRQLSDAWAVVGGIFVVMLLAVILLEWNYWKRIKSYELYKKKKKYFLLVLTLAAVEITAVCIITGVMSRGMPYIGAEAASLLLVFLPLLSGARLLIPWEITPLNEDGTKLFITFLNWVLDRLSTVFIDKK